MYQPYVQLGAAILTQAVEDYKTAIKYLVRHAGGKNAIDAMNTIKEVELFFSAASELYGLEFDTVALFRTFQNRHKEVISRAHEIIEALERRNNDTKHSNS